VSIGADRDERVSGEVPELFRRHYLGLVRLAMRLVDDQDTAEDLVQDVFLAMSQRPADMAEPHAYLRAAVVNRSRSALRRRRVARAFSVGRPDRQVHESADAPALRRADHDRVLAAIHRLPRRQREAVVLRYYEDLGVTEIAEVLGVSPGSVSSALNRAHVALAETMEDRHAE
jgi:RNA polymerase sigma-70 factor (sigma-E family)